MPSHPDRVRRNYAMTADDVRAWLRVNGALKVYSGEAQQESVYSLATGRLIYSLATGAGDDGTGRSGSGGGGNA